MTTTQVLLKRQELIKATRLFASNVIDLEEYEYLKQLYMDAYLTYIKYT